MKAQTCQECNDPLSAGPSLRDAMTKSFHIPLTKWFIGLGDATPEMYCYECWLVTRDVQGQKIFDSGFREGQNAS